MTGFPSDIFRPDPLSELDQVLLDLYLKFGKSVDDLAYSDEFEVIYAELQARGDKRTKGQVYRRLLSLRKSGRLPRVA
ncbi:MAG TPA: hypothetical protein VF777_02800 [Phycisphaerales bacterium]